MRTYNGHDLTPRQLDYLIAYGRHGRTSLAAAALGISKSTLRNELHLLYAQLGVPGIAAALWTVFVEETPDP